MRSEDVSPYDLPAIHRAAQQNARIEGLLNETVRQWKEEQTEKARKFRREWSHQPTPIPPNATGLWYSEECVDQMLVDYALATTPLISETDSESNGDSTKRPKA